MSPEPSEADSHDSEAFFTGDESSSESEGDTPGPQQNSAGRPRQRQATARRSSPRIVPTILFIAFLLC